MNCSCQYLCTRLLSDRGTTCTRYQKIIFLHDFRCIRAASEHGRGASVKVQQYCHSNVCKRDVGRSCPAPPNAPRVNVALGGAGHETKTNAHHLLTVLAQLRQPMRSKFNLMRSRTCAQYVVRMHNTSSTMTLAQSSKVSLTQQNRGRHHYFQGRECLASKSY